MRRKLPLHFGNRNLLLHFGNGAWKMSPLPVLIYSLLMLCFALIGRWVFVNRREGPSFINRRKARRLTEDNLRRRLEDSRPRCSPPPDRKRRSLDPIRH